MRYAILSDIHANFEALKSVLSYISDQEIKGFVICGDILGYGPQPLECMDAIRRLEGENYIVLGNHDAVFVNKMDIRWFNEYARKSIELTIIDDDIRQYLNNLPLVIETENFTVVHGSLKHPLREYLLGEIQYKDNLKLLNNNILFFGHSHIPMYFYTDKEGRVIGDFIKPFAKIKLNDGNKFFLNPGSVGQPRDGNPMASFGIFDDEDMYFELVRVSYDIEKVQKLMKEKGMHDILIERLSMGY